jgi:nucleoside-specific outer membrane channel protein Tsx
MNTKMKKLTIAIMLASSVTAVQAADWSDTWVNYKYQADSREPTNPNDIAKHTIGFTHVSGYKYGSNFVNVDAIKSDNWDPAGVNNGAGASAGAANGTRGAGEGAQEIYVTYRTNFEAGKVTGTPMAFGVIKDVALTAGFDINTKNAGSSGNKRMWVLGPTFMMKMDKGFFNIGTFMSQETNRLAVGGNGRDTTFDVAPMLSASWNIPFQAGLPAKFQGFFNVVGEKGKSYDGTTDTKTEYFSRSSVMWDVGTSMGLKNNTVWAGVGYEYWKNKFGNQKGTGTDVRSLMYMAEWHF